MYPVMMTMVESLIRQNPKKFLSFFNRIKDGEEPEAVMKELYKTDYQGFKEAWRRYIKTAK